MEILKREDEKSDVPAAAEMFWVQCDGFRCLAYRDKAGQWRSAGDDRELTGILRVFPNE